ncbi:MAG: rpsP [Candidatus Saccharibacteria bacterium]|nr:rpsP [Candidatus Saccharibacteria bacterium]
MLAIRLQRVGRAGYATYRLVVQESQRHPSSGRVVAYVGSYNPHTKESNVQVETAQKFLDNGAQPTPRVVKLLKDAGVKLPNWVVEANASKQKTIRHSDKLRRNQPAPEVEEVVEEPVAEVLEAPEEPVEEASAVEDGASAGEAPAQEAAPEVEATEKE